MDLNFDIRGNLKPYERLAISFEAFKTSFIDDFEERSTRHKLFTNYEQYTKNFAEKVTENFTQWINGSFVTNKRNPNDIDLVNLIDYRVIEEKELLIRREFLGDSVYQNFGIDAYLLILYPENHNLHHWTKSDLLYWNDWFTKSKMDNREKGIPKDTWKYSLATQKCHYERNTNHR